MRVLLAAATSNEISITAEWLKTKEFNLKLLITGVGMLATAYSLMKEIGKSRPDLIIQAGIGGSYSEELPPPAVVLVGEELIADLGAMETEGFADIFDMGFESADSSPFTGRLLVNHKIEKWQGLALPVVRGATINYISSTAGQAAIIRDKYQPAVESMEGAALHYVCIREEIPFLQVRAISNFAGDRDKRNWQLPGSIKALNKALQKIIESTTEMT